MKKVYQIRQGKFSNGVKIFQNIDEVKAVYQGREFKILDVGQAPGGHAAILHNSRIAKSKGKK